MYARLCTSEVLLSWQHHSKVMTQQAESSVLSSAMVVQGATDKQDLHERSRTNHAIIPLSSGCLRAVNRP